MKVYRMIMRDHWNDSVSISKALREVEEALNEYDTSPSVELDDNETIADILKRREKLATAVKRLAEMF